MAQRFRGLDLSRPDETTAAELEEFRAYRDQPGGRPLASSALWADLRPDVLKRQMRFAQEIHAAESFSSSLPFLMVYAAEGWVEGVRYQLRLQQGSYLSGAGYTRETIVETLAVAFYLAPTWGTVETASAIREELAGFRDPEPGAPSPFPAGWEVAPEELRAGLDYSTPDLTAADLGALRDWYMRVCGEVPEAIELYAKYRPTLLKADRNRWENIVRTGLPNQMLAFLLVHYEVWRGNVAGARDALLLARGLGMAKEHAVDAVFYGAAFFGATGSVAAVAEPVAELLESW